MYIIPLTADEAGCLYSQASQPLDVKSRVDLVAVDSLWGWRWAGDGLVSWPYSFTKAEVR